MSSLANVEKKKKDNLILGMVPTQGLEHTLSVEKMYSCNFTENSKKFCLSEDYNGASSYLFVNGTEIDQYKAKDFEIVAVPLCLGIISKDWSGNDMKKTGLNVGFYDFSINYNASDVDDILDIYNYLMKKKEEVW